MAFFSVSFYLPRTLLTLRVEPWRIALTPAPAAHRDAPSLTAGRPAVPSCDECPRGVATCWDTLYAETVLWTLWLKMAVLWTLWLKMTVLLPARGLL